MGTSFPRDEAVVADLRTGGLLQPPGRLPGRFEELEYLSQMFGYRPEDGAIP